MLTDTVTVSISPVDVPLGGPRVSHDAFTDQFSVPDPAFQMLKVWLGGLEPPSVALNVSE